MNLDTFQAHIDAYKEQNQILDAAYYLVRSFHLDHENFDRFGFRDEISETSILLTTEGGLGEKQIVNIPRNLFDFDLRIVLNSIAHEMLHVKQKSTESLVTDKNEREWQAYTEWFFRKNFPNLPEPPLFNQKQFCEKALEYYRRMGDGSELQQKYAEEKVKIEALLNEILIKRGEKKNTNNELNPERNDTKHSD